MNNLEAQIVKDIPNPFTAAFTELHNDIKDIKKVLSELNIEVEDLRKKSHSPTEDVILNLKEAAKFLNLSTNSMYRLMKAKQIPNFKSAGKVLFRKTEIIAWIEGGRRNTVNEHSNGK